MILVENYIRNLSGIFKNELNKPYLIIINYKPFKPKIVK